MKLFIPIVFITTLILGSSVQADLLWDNGNHDAVGNGVNDAGQSVLDDFYVPGAGWFVNRAETHGIFLNPGRVVSDVDVVIWPADAATGEPNGDEAFMVGVNGFSAVDTGEDWQGYDKILVSVSFDNTFLKGQEYYWIELDIKDQYGARLKLLERQSVTYGEAHLRSNPYPFPSGVDLAYRLFGTQVAVFNYGGPKDLKLKGLENGLNTVTLQLGGNNRLFQPGYYQIQMQRDVPVVYYFDELGKHRFDFAPNPKEPVKFSTPLGDDMCRNAPDLIYEFCQSFVACAAYEICY